MYLNRTPLEICFFFSYICITCSFVPKEHEVSTYNLMGDLAIITTFGIRVGDRIDGIGGNASAQNLDLFFENIFFSHIV